MASRGSADTHALGAERPGFDRRMTREEINALPLRRYDGAVVVVRSRERLAAALDDLWAEEVLGFDTETRPAFRKGEHHLPALLQLGGARTVHLLQLRHLGLPRELRDLLASPRVVKAGVSLAYDLRELRALAPFEPGGMVDLGEAALRAGIHNHGLRGLGAVLLGLRISKSCQVSNWARDTLTREQIRYAATDAWLGREIYLKMRELGVLPSG